MLLAKKKRYEVGDVVSFKLVNGDEIVAKLEAENDNEFIISTPLTAIPGPTGGIGLVGSMFTAESDSHAPLSKSQVMLSFKTVEMIADHYRQRTTGIETVRRDSKIILK